MDNARRRTLKVVAANLILNAGALAPMRDAGAAQGRAGTDRGIAAAKAPGAGGTSAAPFMIGGTGYSNLGAALIEGRVQMVGAIPVASPFIGLVTRLMLGEQ